MRAREQIHLTEDTGNEFHLKDRQWIEIKIREAQLYLHEKMGRIMLDRSRLKRRTRNTDDIIYEVSQNKSKN